MHTAIVYKSTGSWYTVKDTEGKIYQARMKGIFKIDDEITSTNPIAVGDEVSIEIENSLENTAMITHIHARSNYINRQSPRHKYQQHIVAANINLSILLATLKEPRTSTGFIDRYLVACEMYHIKPIIVYNKADLYKAKEMQAFESIKDMYTSIGYPVYLISVEKKTNVNEIEKLLQNKVSLISGHSGVGKSSFLNLLLPLKQLRTQSISNWSGKGMHTTTFAEMYDLPFGGKLIDTPGMKEFGIVNITKQEVSHYFVEMRPLLSNCQFNNCVHLSEPGCAIKQAVQDNKIFEKRYLSYCNILDSIEEKNY